MSSQVFPIGIIQFFNNIHTYTYSALLLDRLLGCSRLKVLSNLNKYPLVKNVFKS